MPLDAEEVQELGRQGVAIIKRWLEATTFIELPYDVYHQALECTILHKAGTKKFDLAGHYLVGTKDPLIVESKRYGSPGRQYKEFQHFLAIAYSAALRDAEDYGRSKSRHYLWVTFHPFNLDRWKHLETHEEMELALQTHSEYLGGTTIDQNLLRAVAGRVLVLVFNPKQETLSLTRDELQEFRTKVDRKAETL